MNLHRLLTLLIVFGAVASSAPAQEKPVVGLMPKVRKNATGNKKTLDGGFTLWAGSWELFDLPPGVYTLELLATDKAGNVITSRAEKVLHGNPTK